MSPALFPAPLLPTLGTRSVCSRRHPRHAVHAFREPNGLFQLPIFKIQNFDGAAVGTAHVSVCRV